MGYDIPLIYHPRNDQYSDSYIHISYIHMGGSINVGTPIAKMDENRGYPYDSGNLHVKVPENVCFLREKCHDPSPFPSCPAPFSAGRVRHMPQGRSLQWLDSVEQRPRKRREIRRETGEIIGKSWENHGKTWRSPLSTGGLELDSSLQIGSSSRLRFEGS